MEKLTCRFCGGDLIDRGSYCECESCGKRYEKAVSEKEHSEKTVPFEGDEKYETLWKLGVLGMCGAIFLYEEGETIESSLKELEKIAHEAIDDIKKIQSRKKREEAFAKITGHFLGSIYYMNLLNLNGARIGRNKGTETDEEFLNRLAKNLKLKESREKMMDSACADFIRKIMENKGAGFAKMAAERAAEIFAVNLEKKTKQASCQKIEKVWEETKEEITPFYEKELTKAYWNNHKEELEKLKFEKAALDDEIKGYNRRIEKAAEEANEKAFKTLEELDAAELRMKEIMHRIDNLSFFQIKKKKMLVKERDELAVAIKNLENKAIYQKGIGKRNAEAIRKEIGNRWFEAGLMLTRIEQKLEKNYCPSQEPFDEVFEDAIKKARKKLGYDQFDT